MTRRYRGGMEFDGEARTFDAALATRASLTHFAGAGAPDEPRMAKIAQAALFEEALLGALRSRFAEMRAVAK